MAGNSPISIDIAIAESPDKVGLSAASRSALQSFKAGFFNRAKVLKAIDEAEYVSLVKAGAYVRKTAQRSMRYRKAKSNPGEPPSAHQDSPKGPLLRKLLTFAWEPETKSVVVGPPISGKSKGIPKLHEFGGIQQAVRREIKRVGDTGPIRIVDDRFFSFGPSTKFARHDVKQRQVVYIRIKTAKQAAESTAIENHLYGHLDRKFPPRPYMAPALVASKDAIARFWENSLGGGKKS